MAHKTMGIEFFDKSMLTKLLADESLIEKVFDGAKAGEEEDSHRKNMTLLHLAC